MNTDRLVKIADFLDREGLVEEANYIDSLIKRAQEPEPKPEPKEEPKTEEVDEGAAIETDVAEMNKIKDRFVNKFYKELTKAHKIFSNILNEENFGYLGEQNREIIKVSFDALIDAIENEFRSFGVQQQGITASFRLAKKVDNSKVLKDVIKIFTPILDLYEEFSTFMIAYPEFAEKFQRTQKTFLNLKNVLNNIIKSIPEEILDVDLTKD